MDTSPGTVIQLSESYERALAMTREALQAEGFGIITEVDMRATFREKLDREFRPYVILGACNPNLAFTAIGVNPDVGLLLPCNVTVEEGPDGKAIVRIVDPVRLMTGTGLTATPELERVGTEAQERLGRAARRISELANAGV